MTVAASFVATAEEIGFVAEVIAASVALGVMSCHVVTLTSSVVALVAPLPALLVGHGGFVVRKQRPWSPGYHPFQTFLSVLVSFLVPQVERVLPGEITDQDPVE